VNGFVVTVDSRKNMLGTFLVLSSILEEETTPSGIFARGVFI